jgi:hypothetical protein
VYRRGRKSSYPQNRFAVLMAMEDGTARAWNVPHSNGGAGKRAPMRRSRPRMSVFDSVGHERQAADAMILGCKLS